ncbi:MAG: hypothetical protein K2P70_18935 [Hyphomonadaceae bacterium]|nr:hypothetical protein [Hyphomonadaceae bacterium]
MRALDIAAVAVIAIMMLGPLAMAPAYGPYVEPGTAVEFTEATTPLEEGSTPITEDVHVAEQAQGAEPAQDE